ncbi:hypothetical protein U9M48_008798 [Paspalum notatum var. saurae]|uniref:Uncharacterized protein n=1 Tax=Paspalum notatum var. saurae TaxID=547442 RepID=A0AAQ3SPY2_PASNO
MPYAPTPTSLPTQHPTPAVAAAPRVPPDPAARCSSRRRPSVPAPPRSRLPLPPCAATEPPIPHPCAAAEQPLVAVPAPHGASRPCATADPPPVSVPCRQPAGPYLHGNPRCRLPPLWQAVPPAVLAGPRLLGRLRRLPPPPPRKGAPPASSAGSAACVASPHHMGSPRGLPLPFSSLSAFRFSSVTLPKREFLNEVDKFLKNQRGWSWNESASLTVVTDTVYNKHSASTSKGFGKNEQV